MSGLPSCIVLFGASGFIGRNIVDALAGRLDRLIGVTGCTLTIPGCESVVLIDELAKLKDLPDDTVVIHVAAFRYDSTRFELAQSDIIQANATLNAAVYHFCAERDIKEVRLASSVAVYDKNLAVMDDTAPLDLNTPPNRHEAFYAWSKRWAEILADLYADRFGVNTVTFRLSNPYGPYDGTDLAKAHVAPAFVMKALNDAPVFEIRGDAGVERDFIYVGDVVDAFLATLAWRDRHEVFNLCTGRMSTLQELAETALRVAGVNKCIQAGTPGAFGPAKRISSGDRIKAELDMQFTNLEDGLRETIAWYREVMGV